MSTIIVDNKVKRVVSNIRNLPTPPIVFHQMEKVINSPKATAGQVAAVLSEDPAMSAKVLKLTNSAFYGLSREVDSVKQAVVIVGLEAIKNLVLSASVLDMFKGKNLDQESQEEFWRHSLATAVCGRILAEKVKSRGVVDPDSAFSAGLLHDIGKMVILCFLPEEYTLFKRERHINRDDPDYEIEQQVLGYNHAHIGGHLAAHWKLPARLGDAITFHHHPQLNDRDDPLVYLVHIANYLAQKTFCHQESSYLSRSLEPSVLEYMLISESDMDEYGEALRKEYLKAETFMQLAGIS
ncbi:MAG: HDOD domain-containing protein [Candidatus Zixiibacteriota bacterium]